MVNSFFELERMRTGLSEAEIGFLSAGNHRSIVVPKGSEIRTGRASLHLIVDGWATRYRLLSNGRRQIMGLNLSGEVCDLDKLFYPGLTFGVQAVSECRVVEIPVDWIRNVVDDKPAVRDLLWSLTVLENITMGDLVVGLGRRPAQERIAWFLCDLIDRLDSRGKVVDDTFILELTQSDIADLLGLSVVHVNRSLQSLRDGGFLSHQGASYTINQLPALRALANYDRHEMSRLDA